MHVVYLIQILMAYIMKLTCPRRYSQILTKASSVWTEERSYLLHKVLQFKYLVHLKESRGLSCYLLKGALINLVTYTNGDDPPVVHVLSAMETIALQLCSSKLPTMVWEPMSYAVTVQF